MAKKENKKEDKKQDKNQAKQNNSPAYEDITVLKGLNHIRKRPSMYIGSVGFAGINHCLLEVVSNAVDEILESKPKRKEIELEIYKDNSIRVRDYGRGIPFKKTTDDNGNTVASAYIAATVANAGGKFDESNYKASGGLFGVGMSAVSALSKEFELTSIRNDEMYEMKLVYVKEKPKKLNKDEFYDPINSFLVKQNWSKNTKNLPNGTDIRFLLDFATYFKEDHFDTIDIIEDAKNQALITNIVFKVKNNINNTTEIFENKNGLKQGLISLNEEIEEGRSHTPIYELNYEDTEKGIKIDFVFEWVNDYEEQHFPYVNSTIFTKDGGTQIDQFTNSLLKYINTNTKNNFKKNAFVLGLKTYSNTTIPVNLNDLANQTKTELNVEEVRPVIIKAFENFKLKDTELKTIVKFLKDNEKLKAKEDELRQINKNNKVNKIQLMSNFVNCASKDPKITELFLVEGSSSLASSKEARDAETQAILPLKGKVLNSINATLIKVLENKELKTLIDCLGCGYGKNFEYEKLKFNKIIVSTDADADGNEIRSLLLSFFVKYMPQLIEKGHVYYSVPPLYMVKIKDKYVFFKDVDELNKWRKQNKNNANNPIKRLKGLGEMNSDELAITVMHKDTRSLIQLSIEDIENTLQKTKIFFATNKHDERELVLDNYLIVTNKDINLQNIEK